MFSRKKNIYEISIIFKQDNECKTEILQKVLISLGINGNEIVTETVKGKEKVAFYCQESLKARVLKQKIKDLKLKKISVNIKSLEDKDWLNKWKKEFKPFKLTKKLYVVPSWLKDNHKYKKNEVIYIDTNLAFGTGMHPTTKAISNFIEGYHGNFKTFLDIGTGTGILAIVAYNNDAEKISVVDISKDCIKCAKSNFILNNITRIKTKVSDIFNYKDDKKYDFVAANLITDDLIKFRKKIISLVNNNKYLAVSGVSVNNFEKFKKAFNKSPLKCVKITKNNKWAAFLYKRQA